MQDSSRHSLTQGSREACALALAAEGVNAVISGWGKDALNSTARITSGGGTVHAIVACRRRQTLTVRTTSSERPLIASGRSHTCRQRRGPPAMRALERDDAAMT